METTMTKSLILPKTIQEFSFALKSGIESFQGNPVKNANKFNETLSISLGFDNYNQLSPLLESSPDLAHTPIFAHKDGFKIGNTLIETKVFNQPHIPYKIVNRQDEILNIIEILYRNENVKNKELYFFNLSYLSSSTDDFVFFIEDDTEQQYFSETLNEIKFYAICNRILDCQNNFTDGEFKPFWFEGNLWFQMVKNEKDLNELFEVHLAHGYTKEKVLLCRECVRSNPRDADMPKKFGFASECRDDRRLLDFLNNK
jgi:hypothetical protein